MFHKHKGMKKTIYKTIEDQIRDMLHFLHLHLHYKRQKNGPNVFSFHPWNDIWNIKNQNKRVQL